MYLTHIAKDSSVIILVHEKEVQPMPNREYQWRGIINSILINSSNKVSKAFSETAIGSDLHIPFDNLNYFWTKPITNQEYSDLVTEWETLLNG